MPKPAMVIDLLSKGPGDEEDEESPLDDEGDAPREDPEALIASIEAKLSQLRRAL